MKLTLSAPAKEPRAKRTPNFARPPITSETAEAVASAFCRGLTELCRKHGVGLDTADGFLFMCNPACNEPLRYVVDGDSSKVLLQSFNPQDYQRLPFDDGPNDTAEMLAKYGRADL